MYLQTKGLTKVFGKKKAVDQLDLSVESGSLTALLGPNGAGKSTTVEMLLGLLRPTSGVIQYETDSKLGVVFQNSILDDELTVHENLQFRAKMIGQNNEKNLLQIMKQMGVNEFAGQRYGKLSGGQRRRVDIARALLGQPKILFLDEPTTGLDIQTRRTIWEVLSELRQDKSLTIVLTTHYLEEADHADMVYIIDKGKIIANGSADYLRHKYAHNQLIIQTDAINDLAGHLANGINYERVNEDTVQIVPKSTAEALQILTMGATLITHFEYREGTMNDAFIALTGREMH